MYIKNLLKVIKAYRYKKGFQEALQIIYALLHRVSEKEIRGWYCEIVLCKYLF